MHTLTPRKHIPSSFLCCLFTLHALLLTSTLHAQPQPQPTIPPNTTFNDLVERTQPVRQVAQSTFWKTIQDQTGGSSWGTPRNRSSTPSFLRNYFGPCFLKQTPQRQHTRQHLQECLQHTLNQRKTLNAQTFCTLTAISPKKLPTPTQSATHIALHPDLLPEPNNGLLFDDTFGRLLMNHDLPTTEIPLQLKTTPNVPLAVQYIFQPSGVSHPQNNETNTALESSLAAFNLPFQLHQEALDILWNTKLKRERTLHIRVIAFRILDTSDTAHPRVLYQWPEALLTSHETPRWCPKTKHSPRPIHPVQQQTRPEKTKQVIIPKENLSGAPNALRIAILRTFEDNRSMFEECFSHKHPTRKPNILRFWVNDFGSLTDFTYSWNKPLYPKFTDCMKRATNHLIFPPPIDGMYRFTYTLTSP